MSPYLRLLFSTAMKVQMSSKVKGVNHLISQYLNKCIKLIPKLYENSKAKQKRTGLKQKVHFDHLYYLIPRYTTNIIKMG